MNNWSDYWSLWGEHERATFHGNICHYKPNLIMYKWVSPHQVSHMPKNCISPPRAAILATHAWTKLHIQIVSWVSSVMASEVEGFVCLYCLVGFVSSSKLQSHLVDMHLGQAKWMTTIQWIMDMWWWQGWFSLVYKVTYDEHKICADLRVCFHWGEQFVSGVHSNNANCSMSFRAICILHLKSCSPAQP